MEILPPSFPLHHTVLDRAGRDVNASYRLVGARSDVTVAIDYARYRAVRIFKRHNNCLLLAGIWAADMGRALPKDYGAKNRAGTYPMLRLNGFVDDCWN